jgi:hypothetical protein
VSAELKAGGQWNREVCEQRFPVRTGAVLDYRIRIQDRAFVGLSYVAEELARGSLGLFDINPHPALLCGTPQPPSLLQTNRKGGNFFPCRSKVILKITGFWDVTSSGFLGSYQRFRVTYCLHLQGTYILLANLSMALQPFGGSWPLFQFLNPIHGR